MNNRHLLATCALGVLLIGAPAWANDADGQTTPATNGQTTTGTDQTTTPDTDPDDPNAPQKGKVRVEERDVVVTGARAAKLLDAPQGKSIINAEERNLSGVNSARELVLSQPGFNYTDDFGINVRGVGRQTAQTLLGQENTVTEYVDGFLNIVPTNIGESTLFGGNVSFIRGPAGTTYGRNAIAGAINIQSRAPTADFTAQVVGGLGRKGAFNLGANIAGPITDTLGFRLGAQKFRTPSIYRAVGGVDGAGFAVDNLYIEFQLQWRVGGFHFRNRATTFSYDNQPAYPTLSRYSNGLNGNSGGSFGALSPNPQFGFTGAVPNQPFTTNVNTRGYDRLRKNFQDIFNADVDLGFASLVYVGGYQKYLATGQADQDLTSRTSYDAGTVAPGTFAAGTQVPTDYRTNYSNDNYYWTQEARLEGKSGGAVNWVLGYYHYDQHFDETYYENIVNATDTILTPAVGTPGLTLAPNPRRSTYEQRNLYTIISNAVFGNITWNVSPTVVVDAGLRETFDNKHAVTNFRYIYYYPPVYAADFSPLIHGSTPERRESGLSGRASIAWKPSPGNQIYASYTRGYQSSAFTLGQGLTGPDPSRPRNIADKEFLDVFEIGGNLTSGPIRFDGSLFYQSFDNQQIPISTRGVFVGPNGPAPGTVYTAFVNARRTEIYGAEAQLTWHPNAQSTIVASYTYLHPVFRDFCPLTSGSTSCGVVDISEPTTSPLSGVLQNLTGNELPRAPRHKMSLYGYYGIDLGGAGHLYPGGTIFHQSSFYTSPFTVSRFKVPSRTVVNATLTYRTADDRIDITGGVSNLFRERYTDSSVLATFGGGNVSQAVYYGADRNYTLTARLRF